MGFIDGAYSPRHASANAPQSVFTPVRRVSSSPSRITEPRQSTTVPKTSKVSALIWPRARGFIVRLLMRLGSRAVAIWLANRAVAVVANGVARGTGRDAAAGSHRGIANRSRGAVLVPG